MILNNVADCTGFIIEGASTLDSKVLSHCDLHAFDVVAIPKRLQERVGKTEEKHVVHRPLPPVIVDAEDSSVIKRAEQNPVKILRRSEDPTEGLFANHTSGVTADLLCQLFDD